MAFTGDLMLQLQVLSLQILDPFLSDLNLLLIFQNSIGELCNLLYFFKFCGDVSKIEGLFRNRLSIKGSIICGDWIRVSFLLQQLHLISEFLALCSKTLQFYKGFLIFFLRA